MPPLTTMSVPSSLLVLPTSCQGIRRNRGGWCRSSIAVQINRLPLSYPRIAAVRFFSPEKGQSREEPSILGSQSRRTKLRATISAKAMSCVASMNITCCANQTQTARRKSFSGPTSPPSGSVKEKVKGPRLDDGGVGFPPFRFGGGGGGGGGGGSSSSGGFILFVIVLLLDYLREFERNLQNGQRRGSDYDNGLAPQ